VSGLSPDATDDADDPEEEAGPDERQASTDHRGLEVAVGWKPDMEAREADIDSPVAR
jgi:hypothetical protein